MARTPPRLALRPRVLVALGLGPSLPSPIGGRSLLGLDDVSIVCADRSWRGRSGWRGAEQARIGDAAVPGVQPSPARGSKPSRSRLMPLSQRLPGEGRGVAATVGGVVGLDPQRTHRSPRLDQATHSPEGVDRSVLLDLPGLEAEVALTPKPQASPYPWGAEVARLGARLAGEAEGSGTNGDQGRRP